MKAFWLANLLPPGALQIFTLKTPAGLWTFKQSSAFNAVEDEIRNKGACADTYAIEFLLPTDGTRNRKGCGVRRSSADLFRVVFRDGLGRNHRASSSGIGRHIRWGWRTFPSTTRHPKPSRVRERDE